MMGRLKAFGSEAAVLALLVACLGALIVFFVPPSLHDLGVASAATSYDLHSGFLPKFIYGTEELVAGRLPLWNPYEYGGIPFLATAQPAVFYPPKILVYALFDPHIGYWVFQLGHFVLMGLGFVLLMREFDLRGPAAFVGAALWMFSVPVLISNYHPTRVANLSWMPFVFLFVERWGRTKSWPAYCLLILAVALQLFSGYPEFSLDSGLLVAIHATMRYATGAWQRPPWKTLPLLGGAFVLGAFVAAAQLLPLAELSSVSSRAAVAKTEEWRFGGDLAPYLSGMFWPFPAFIALSFAGIPGRRGASPAAALLLCALMGAGGWLLIRALPGFSMVRYPWTWFLITPFYLSWLAAVGTWRLMGNEADAPRRRRSAAAFVVACGLAWAVYCALRLSRLQDATPAPHPTIALMDRVVPTALSATLGVVSGLVLAAIGAANLGRRARLPAPVAFGAATLVTIAHLSGYPYGQTTAPVKRPSPHGLVQRLAGGRDEIDGRVFSLRDILYGYNLTDRIPDIFGSEVSFLPIRYRHTIDDLRMTPLGQSVEWDKLFRARGFLDAMNLQFLVALPSQRRMLKKRGFKHIRSSREWALFENKKRMGEAWVNHGVRHVDSAEEARRHVFGRDFDPRREVVLEGRTARSYPPSSTTVTLPESVHRPSTNTLDLSVVLPEPGVLVVSESAYPGWRVTVDGEPAEWVWANYVLRGVELGAGRHEVHFEYRPWSVRWGLAVSGVSLAGVLAALGVLLHRQRAVRRTLRR